VNKAAGLMGFAFSYAAFTWWLRWIESRDFWTDRNLLLDNVAFFGVLAVIIVVHELGHLAAGLALGMKLRLFALGPFQLKRSKCRWKFEFSAKLMKGRDGAVGLLPAMANQPRWHDAVVAGAGPLINLATGAIAIWISETLSNDAPLESHGVLALFGAMSVAIGLSSIVPFRLGKYYSDGARFIQHVRRLPYSDLMRVMQMVTAVGETQLRPRDYDIEAIERVLTLHPTGTEAHYLKLYIYDSCLDQGKIAEASQALVEAEAIYDSCALMEETEISFVLGHAGLRGDADAARRWWQRLEARTSERSESGYWIAKCAMNRAEGRQDEATEALRQADAIIAEMPPTGSQACSMEWSARLREEIKRIPEKASLVVA
jgi:tetratricopeptide (TPR) repeat protein